VDAIATKTDLRKTAVRRGLKSLTDERQVIRSGSGSRGDPYLYRRCYTVDSDDSLTAESDSPTDSTAA
jgi:hypothetical protein